MNDQTFRAAWFGLLASTALASPAFAQNAQPQTTGQSPAPGTNATDVTAPPPRAQAAQDGNQPDQTEIIITATKREENLQNVPISVQAIGTRRLDQLNISNFEDYTKQLPSVTFLTAQPGATTVYMRGVSAAGSAAEGNHSGPVPQVGFYLDEQPITTIGGTLDVHIYDIARIESLSGPQGTLYGASSEAGTIRIITNKPELGVTAGRVDGEINSVAHGGIGGKLEGMINLPIGRRIAFRGVAFYQRDAGYIDNIFGSRTYCNPIYDDDGAGIGCTLDGITVTNAGLEKKNFNDPRRLWRPGGAQGRPRRQLDRHSDLHVPEDQGQRGVLLRSQARRPQHRPLPQGAVTRPLLAGGADHPGQDPQFRRDLCRRLHGSSDVRD